MHGVDPLDPGVLLAGRYRIGALLGTGGMSVVHRGTDEALGREVAVKVLLRGSSDPAELERAQAEIDVLATLNHRALVTLFDAGSAAVDGRAATYLVMELIDGPTLGARSALGELAPADVAAMARDLAAGLTVVHGGGVVHRDIKPANVLLSPSPLPGREFDAKLADFGIAAIVDGERLTATGTVLGTAAYLSPEQATGARVGPASDIYSLGLVLLEAITGRREYPGPLMESLSARQWRDPDVPGSIGYPWKSLLTAMTAREPGDRPTAAEVLHRLADESGALVLPLSTARTAPREPDGARAVAATATLTAPAVAGGTTATTAAAAAAVGAVAPASGRAHTEQLRRARRSFPAGWPIVSGVAAGLVVLAAIVALAFQGFAIPGPGNAPSVAETLDQTPPADQGTESPAPTTEPPALEPAVDDEATDGTGLGGADQGGAGQATVGQETGNQGAGNQGQGNGNPGNGNPGNGNPGNGDQGNGSQGGGNQGNDGQGSGNQGGGSGGGDGGGPGNG